MNFSAILICISLISEAAAHLFMFSSHLFFLFGVCLPLFYPFVGPFMINVLLLPSVLALCGMSCKLFFSGDIKEEVIYAKQCYFRKLILETMQNEVEK